MRMMTNAFPEGWGSTLALALAEVRTDYRYEVK